MRAQETTGALIGGLGCGFAVASYQSPFALAGLAALAIGARITQRARRARAPTVDELRARDPRAPILFLRSFETDDLQDKEDRRNPLAMTHEEHLAATLGKLGPVVAVGAPGEKQSPIGAARLYLADDRWQQAVTAMMEEAALIVLRAGRTKGFWWEVQQTLRLGRPERVVIVFPFVGRSWDEYRELLYARFCKRLRRAVRTPLPERLGNAVALHFDTGWNATLLRPRRRRWHRRFLAGIRNLVLTGTPLARFGNIDVEALLEPVARQAGLPWGRSAIGPPKGVYANWAAGVAIAWLLLAAYAMWL